MDRTKNTYNIRKASVQDSKALTLLSEQLGYPVLIEDAYERIDEIVKDKSHCIYVAQLANGGLVGFLHVHTYNLFYSKLKAEISGLVVDKKFRHLGIGRKLVEEGESWARENGCYALSVRSNVIRKDAHEFYKSIGYAEVKKQCTFRKELME